MGKIDKYNDWKIRRYLEKGNKLFFELKDLISIQFIYLNLSGEEKEYPERYYLKLEENDDVFGLKISIRRKDVSDPEYNVIYPLLCIDSQYEFMEFKEKIIYLVSRNKFSRQYNKKIY